MANARAPGQVGYSLVAAVFGLALSLAGVAMMTGAIDVGLAVGAGVALCVAELTRLARLSATVGVVAGGIAAGVVVAFADGVISLSLPAVVGGAGLALVVVGAARYAEHVIAIEGPATAGAAMAARLWLPWRDLFLALGGHPLRQHRALASPPATSPAARTR